MATFPPQDKSRDWFATARLAIVEVLTRPLPLPKFLAIAALLIAAFTLYCAVYCIVAYSFLRGARMPLQLSAAWAFSIAIPWAICFELCKRARALPLAWQAVAIVGSFTVASLIAISLGLGLAQLLGNSAPLRLSMELAHLLPGAGLTALLIVVARSIPPFREEQVSVDMISGTDLQRLLEIASQIEWIRAAGNYVEARQAGGTQLYRVTMQSLEHALNDSRFVRIHRQVIVNSDFVAARLHSGSASALRMIDGTIFKIGGRYERNWAAISRSPNQSVRH